MWFEELSIVYCLLRGNILGVIIIEKNKFIIIDIIYFMDVFFYIMK